MNLILVGPPGAGKGTQAKMIAAKYGLAHISTGDMFRETAAGGSELGKTLQGYMSQGKLVPDDVVIQVVKERLAKADCAAGFLLDGFPRTVPQAAALDAMLQVIGRKIDSVPCLVVEDEVIVRRLSGRRVCPSCGGSFNITSQPPETADICDFCKAGLVQRADDNAETIRQRLSVYHEQTHPLIDYYTKAGVLCSVEGSRPVEEVFKDIRECIENR